MNLEIWILFALALSVCHVQCIKWWKFPKSFFRKEDPPSVAQLVTVIMLDVNRSPFLSYERLSLNLAAMPTNLLSALGKALKSGTSAHDMAMDMANEWPNWLPYCPLRREIESLEAFYVDCLMEMALVERPPTCFPHCYMGVRDCKKPKNDLAHLLYAHHKKLYFQNPTWKSRHFAALKATAEELSNSIKDPLSGIRDIIAEPSPGFFTWFLKKGKYERKVMRKAAAAFILNAVESNIYASYHPDPIRWMLRIKAKASANHAWIEFMDPEEEDFDILKSIMSASSLLHSLPMTEGIKRALLKRHKLQVNPGNLKLINQSISESNYRLQSHCNFILPDHLLTVVAEAQAGLLCPLSDWDGETKRQIGDIVFAVRSKIIGERVIKHPLQTTVKKKLAVIMEFGSCEEIAILGNIMQYSGEDLALDSMDILLLIAQLRRLKVKDKDLTWLLISLAATKPSWRKSLIDLLSSAKGQPSSASLISHILNLIPRDEICKILNITLLDGNGNETLFDVLKRSLIKEHLTDFPYDGLNRLPLPSLQTVALRWNHKDPLVALLLSALGTIGGDLRVHPSPRTTLSAVVTSLVLKCSLSHPDIRSAHAIWIDACDEHGGCLLGFELCPDSTMDTMEHEQKHIENDWYECSVLLDLFNKYESH